MAAAALLRFRIFYLLVVFLLTLFLRTRENTEFSRFR